MVERSPQFAADEDAPISVFRIAAVLIERRRLVLALSVLGLAMGVAMGLLSRRQYQSSATFVPQGAQGSASGLAAAASQLGFAIPSSGSAWGAPMYVELAQSRALLGPLLHDTITVMEERNRRSEVIDLLDLDTPPGPEREEAGVLALNKVIAASEEKKLGGVRVTVTTRWPSVSLAIARRLVERINNFNIETRKSQAKAERKFVETQAAQAEQALREAEDRLQSFSQQNREFAPYSPMSLERDRLQRTVSRLNAAYTTWLQNREEARIREIRDTPVITLLEEPQLPFLGVPRGTVRKGLVGGVTGMVLAIIWALLAQWLRTARATGTEDSRAFFAMLDRVRPRFGRGEKRAARTFS